MSGLPIARAKIAPSGWPASSPPVAASTLDSDLRPATPTSPRPGPTRLNSIAAVVLGGTSLLGGIGRAIASLIGAFILRVISSTSAFSPMTHCCSR